MREHLILIATLAIVFVGGLTCKAEAAAWTSAARMKAMAKNYSPIEKVQAAGNACPTGFTGVVAAVSVSAAHTADVNLPAIGS